MVDFLEQIYFVHDVFEIVGRHLGFVEHFDGHLEFRVFTVHAFINFAEGALPKDVSIDVILQLKLVHPCLDFD